MPAQACCDLDIVEGLVDTVIVFLNTKECLGIGFQDRFPIGTVHAIAIDPKEACRIGIGFAFNEGIAKELGDKRDALDARDRVIKELHAGHGVFAPIGPTLFDELFHGLPCQESIRRKLLDKAVQV